MQALLRLSQVIDDFMEKLGKFTYWLVPLVILVGVWNVGGRYIGRLVGRNLSSNLFIELQWYLFAIIFLLGSAYVLKHNGHVRVDVFYGNWPTRRKILVNLLGAIFFLIPFSILMIHFSWSAVIFSWQIQEQSPDPFGLPRYPLKTVIIFCFSLLIIQGISEIIKNVAMLTGHLHSADEPISDQAT